MFGLGMPELIVILLIAFLIFGVGKLPHVGEGLGKAIRGFRKAMSEPDPGENPPAKKEPPRTADDEKP